MLVVFSFSFLRQVTRRVTCLSFPKKQSFLGTLFYFTCSVELNSTCAKVLLRKTLETPDCRRIFFSQKAARIHSEQFFFTSTVQSHIAQPSGWDNRGKRRAFTDIFPVFHCTAPTQGRLPRRTFGCRPFLRRSGIIPRSVPRFSLVFPYPTRPTGELWCPKSHNLFPIVESGGTGKAKSRRSMPL